MVKNKANFAIELTEECGRSTDEDAKCKQQ